MIQQRNKINVAIDGPAGAGKSTIARLVSNELGYVYIDTGAMYRAVTLTAMNNGILPDQENDIVELTRGLDIELIPEENGQKVIVNGKDVTQSIRSNEINQQVSKFAGVSKLRKLLVMKQQQLASSKGVVMDGRDIATHVIPNAEVKIFLTASVEERASRRYKEMLEKSPSIAISLEQLQKDISLRDQMDLERKASPLKMAEDAIKVDSTNMTILEVVQTIKELCIKKMGGDNHVIQND
ncbi:(d)CMP kinase [Chengkuizengella axinellae]|uniref:Cytidylate kinase n=1 Tax=Chengkuizengella axinellae TaxID=3064388 RepID=A0ABT9IX03_9BACL|nr:(d)CMP kinase [Chengkuizengella sp. 2205SS18-9]MDP5273778.1 (d)CMP kinase [Chengkuizengella sp. 2205SS18-9]